MPSAGGGKVLGEDAAQLLALTLLTSIHLLLWALSSAPLPLRGPLCGAALAHDLL